MFDKKLGYSKNRYHKNILNIKNASTEYYGLLIQWCLSSIFCDLCDTWTKYLVVSMYTLKFFSNCTDTIMIIESRYSANRISKCFVQNT